MPVSDACRAEGEAARLTDSSIPFRMVVAPPSFPRPRPHSERPGDGIGRGMGLGFLGIDHARCRGGNTRQAVAVAAVCRGMDVVREGRDGDDEDDAVREGNEP